MKVALVTGSSGLVGSQAVEFFIGKGFKVIGVDNNLRQYFFGKGASTEWNRKRLQKKFKDFEHKNLDIRDFKAFEKIFKQYGKEIKLIIHAAAQPSHDWAVREPLIDFEINAKGTLNLLELTRINSPSAVFIFTSTNKVYGDLPNTLPLVELETRWELPKGHRFYKGIDESMSIDHSKHSLFGVSKLAADILVQEYGRYFGMKTVSFRAGCLSGPAHSGAELHGFLSYLVRCCLTKTTYKIFGYKGKQVRDNLHSYDLVNAFYHFYQNPKIGEVYNIGGGRFANVSLGEAIALTAEICGKKIRSEYLEKNRSGDHMWWISDISKFSRDYPGWKLTMGIKETIKQIFQQQRELKAASKT